MLTPIVSNAPMRKRSNSILVLLYSVQENRFQENWRDPRLHIKKVQTLSHALSFRITRRYRVFFYFQNIETAIFFDVDHRKDIYR